MEVFSSKNVSPKNSAGRLLVEFDGGVEEAKARKILGDTEVDTLKAEVLKQAKIALEIEKLAEK